MIDPTEIYDRVMAGETYFRMQHEGELYLEGFRPRPYPVDIVLRMERAGYPMLQIDKHFLQYGGE